MAIIIKKQLMNIINGNFKGLQIICLDKIDIMKKRLNIKKISLNQEESIEKMNDLKLSTLSKSNFFIYAEEDP